MAEDTPIDSTDDIELASELTRSAAERQLQDRLLDDSERTLATDDSGPQDDSRGGVHLGSRGADELSGLGADDGGGWNGFDAGAPIAIDVPADGGWPQADVLARGGGGSGISEIRPPDGISLATGGDTGPRPRIVLEETEASPLRIAPRLMPDTEAETEAPPAVAADTGEPSGNTEFFVSPVAQTEETTTDVGSGGNTDTVSGDQGSGGAGVEILNGGAGDDTLDGGAGNDTLDGGAGGDVLYGGSGKDSLVGGAGDDVLYGGGGKDTLDGNAGDDVLYGGSGKDTLDGGAGDDALYGGAGKDTLYGGAGDDYLSGGAGNDIAWGGDGADTYVFMEAMGNDTFHGGTGHGGTGSWIDIIELQDASGNAPTDGWSFGLTAGSVVSSGEGFAELSDDAAGTITMDDGSTLSFDGVEKFIW